MTKFELFKLIHVILAMVWVGGSILAQVAALRLKNASPEHRLGFARDMRFVATWVYLPSAVLVYLFGSLAVEQHVTFDYEQTWIGIGTLGVLVGFLVAAFYLTPQTRKAVKLMESGKGPEAGAVIGRVAITARILIVILLVVIWAMVAKPGL